MATGDITANGHHIKNPLAAFSDSATQLVIAMAGCQGGWNGASPTDVQLYTPDISRMVAKDQKGHPRTHARASQIGVKYLIGFGKQVALARILWIDATGRRPLFAAGFRFDRPEAQMGPVCATSRHTNE